MTAKETTLDDPLLEMKRTVVALGAELPEAVWLDVKDRFNTLSEHVQQVRSALTLACVDASADGEAVRRHYMAEAERLHGQWHPDPIFVTSSFLNG